MPVPQSPCCKKLFLISNLNLPSLNLKDPQKPHKHLSSITGFQRPCSFAVPKKWYADISSHTQDSLITAKLQVQALVYLQSDTEPGCVGGCGFQGSAFWFLFYLKKKEKKNPKRQHFVACCFHELSSSEPSTSCEMWGSKHSHARARRR